MTRKIYFHASFNPEYYDYSSVEQPEKQKPEIYQYFSMRKSQAPCIMYKMK